MPASSRIIEVLRTTLIQLEQAHDPASEDRALRELKARSRAQLQNWNYGLTPHSVNRSWTTF
jgi:hypothetical protein